VIEERDPKTPQQLDKESERGDVSQDGFGDYDEEFHPADVETDEAQPSDSESSALPMPQYAWPEARYPAEVHFRTLSIRNRGTSMGPRIAGW
jgi:hypothetical protein